MNHSGIRGFSLVELMLSLVLGLLVTSVMIATFNSSSKSARTQTALLRVLDNGRFASQYISDELRLVGTQYCSTFANKDLINNTAGVTPRNAFTIGFAGAARPKWLPADTGGPLEVDPGVFVRGYKCGSSTCSPALPGNTADINVVPAIGTSAGNRAANTDVLTIRYMRSDGVSLGSAAFGGPNGGPNGVYLSYLLAPSVTTYTGPPLNFVVNSDIAMIADCNYAEVFIPAFAGNLMTHPGGAGFNYLSNFGSVSFNPKFDSRVFNFTKDFMSVTYYVGIRDDPDDATHKISSLMRITNGGAAEVVVDGVERFNLTFGAIDRNNAVRYLDASQVNALSGDTVCPPINVTSGVLANYYLPGCMWRGVSSVEVSMLMNSVVDSDEAGEPFRYSPDGTAVQSLAATATLPNGLPAGRMKRREFRFLANLHSVSR